MPWSWGINKIIKIDGSPLMGLLINGEGVDSSPNYAGNSFENWLKMVDFI